MTHKILIIRCQEWELGGLPPILGSMMWLANQPGPKKGQTVKPTQIVGVQKSRPGDSHLANKFGEHDIKIH